MIRLLYERGYTREHVIELLRLIDWMIRLPDNLEIKFKDFVHQIEEEQHMAYVTSIERLAMEEGKLEAALKMIREFHLSAKDVAEKLQIPLKDIMAHLNQSDKST